MPNARPDDAELTRRLERFLQTNDTSALWPGLTESARVEAGREIERVVRAVLRGDRDVVIDPHGRHDPYALQIAGHTTGVGPLLGRWARDGYLTSRDAVIERFTRQLDSSRQRAERITREVLPAFDALIAHGITPVLLKGAHTSRVYFEEPGARRMSDVDIVIPPEALDAAEDALRTIGFQPADSARATGKRDWIGPTVEPIELSLELDDPRSKWTIELHTSLDRRFHPGAIAALDSERAEVEPFDLAGRSVFVPRPALLVVLLACHCSQELDASRLLRLVEIVRVVRAERAAARLDWNDVLSILERTGAARYTYPALALAEDLAPDTIEPQVLAMARRDSTWAARHTVARLAPVGGSLERRGVLRQIMWTRGAVSIVQRALRTLWPASFLRPGDVIPGWRARLRRLRAGTLSLTAPDERRPPNGE